MPLFEPRRADVGQPRFHTTNPGFYLRTRAERGDMLGSFVLSVDEFDEEGLEGMIVKERRYWYRQSTCLLGEFGSKDPRQIRLLRNAWARHQRLLEGPPITSREQVDFQALLGIKHFDPTSLAYALKVYHEIDGVLGTEILPATQAVHEYLGTQFPTLVEIRRIKAVMCWDAPVIFFSEDHPCDEKELVRLLAKMDTPAIALEGISGLPCGVTADSADLRHRWLGARKDEWKSHDNTCFACPGQKSSSPQRLQPQTDAIFQMALDEDDILQCKTLVRCARLHSSREGTPITATTSGDVVDLSD
jgi:hypothetical protein